MTPRLYTDASPPLVTADMKRQAYRRNRWTLPKADSARAVARAVRRMAHAAAGMADRERKRGDGEVYCVLLRTPNLFEFLNLKEAERAEIWQERHGLVLTQEALTKRFIKPPILVAMNHNSFYAAAARCLVLGDYRCSEMLDLYRHVAPRRHRKADRDCCRAKAPIFSKLWRRFHRVAVTDPGPRRSKTPRLRRELPSPNLIARMTEGLSIWTPSSLELPALTSRIDVPQLFAANPDDAEMQRIRLLLDPPSFERLTALRGIDGFSRRARTIVLRPDPPPPDFGADSVEDDDAPLDLIDALIEDEVAREMRARPDSLRLRIDGIERARLEPGHSVAMLLEAHATLVEVVASVDDDDEVVVATYVLTYAGRKREAWSVDLPWSDDSISCSFEYGDDDCVGATFERRRRPVAPRRPSPSVPDARMEASARAYAERILALSRFQAGETVSDYKVVFFLGAGCGKTYLASSLREYSLCALKVYKYTKQVRGFGGEQDYAEPERFEFASWLSSFSHAASSVRHPHIASTLEVHLCDSHFMWVREFVEGCTLLERQREGPMTSAAAYYVVAQMLDGLGHLHRHGLAHGDLKPSNVILSHDGVKLVDFGLTREVRQRWITCFDRTVSYAAPEQLDGSGSMTDAQSDLYSVGLIAYEMLTGARPLTFHLWDVDRATDAKELVPISEINPSVPPQLSDVVLQAISRTPADRFQNADEFHCAWSSCSSWVFHLTAETTRRDRHLMRKFRRGDTVGLETLHDSYARLIDGYLRRWDVPAPSHESCTNQTLAILMFFGRDNDETAFLELLWRAVRLALCQTLPERMAEEIDRLVALESAAAQKVLTSADEQGLTTADLFERSSKALEALLVPELAPFEKLRSELAWFTNYWYVQNEATASIDRWVAPPQDWRAAVSLARRLALRSPDERISCDAIPSESVNETIAAADRALPGLKLRPAIAAIVRALLKE